MEKLLEEINALAKKSKSKEGLNVHEKERQKNLRTEYIKIFRQNFKNQLENIEFVDNVDKIDN